MAKRWETQQQKNEQQRLTLQAQSLPIATERRTNE